MAIRRPGFGHVYDVLGGFRDDVPWKWDDFGRFWTPPDGTKAVTLHHTEFRANRESTAEVIRDEK